MSTSHHKSIFVRLGESKHQNFRHPDHSLSPISFWNTTCYPEGIVIRRPPPLKLRRWRTRICQPKHSKPLVLCQVPRLVNMRRSHTRDLHAWFKENMTEVGNSFLIYPQDYRHQFSCVNSCRKFANRLANDSSYNMDVFAPSKAAHTIPWLILLTPCAPLLFKLSSFRLILLIPLHLYSSHNFLPLFACESKGLRLPCQRINKNNIDDFIPSGVVRKSYLLICV